MARYLVAFLFGSLLLGLPQAAPSGIEATTPRILLFTKTSAFRHDSIPAAVAAIRELGQANGLTVDATQDSAAFTDTNLARYDAVVFLLTTGDVLDESQQQAFEQYIRRGHGFAGVHSAADTEYGWTWYGGLIGAFFKSHPQVQRATVRVVDRTNPSTAGLPRAWARTDEWYNFARNPRPSVHVLARLDETSYSPGPGAMGADHPIAWWHSYQGGRAWYTAGGHAAESYAEPRFRRHLLGGIRYAAGLTPPQILRLGTSLRDRRLRLAVRYRTCTPCSGVLRVRGVSRTRFRLANGKGAATTSRLPSGRLTVTVTLRDPTSGVADAVSRRVIVH
jgi:type 1 glutamine amidotransferase